MAQQQQQQNYYEILNVNQNATLEELKAKYKQMILQCHPDKLLQQQQDTIDDIRNLENDLNGSSRQEFVAIAEAWNCLKDPLKRKKYDAELLLNKFYAHNNIYAHITLEEMTKCIDEDGDDDDEESDNNTAGTIKSPCYYYTYDCRCGGQYIVDESAVEYCCQQSKSTTNNSQQCGDAATTAHNENNSPYNTDNEAAKNGNVNILNAGKGVFPNQNHCKAKQYEEDKDTDDNELIVECSECSLVIILLKS